MSDLNGGYTVNRRGERECEDAAKRWCAARLRAIEMTLPMPSATEFAPEWLESDEDYQIYHDLCLQEELMVCRGKPLSVQAALRNCTCAAEWNGTQYVVGNRWYSANGDDWHDGIGHPVNDENFADAVILLVGGPLNGSVQS